MNKHSEYLWNGFASCEVVGTLGACDGDPSGVAGTQGIRHSSNFQRFAAETGDFFAPVARRTDSKKSTTLFSIFNHSFENSILVLQ